MFEGLIETGAEVVLPPTEQAEFQQAHDEIGSLLAGVKRATLRIGALLLEIRERRWYRSLGYLTFEAYCENEWKFTRQRAYQLMDGANVVARIEESAGATEMSTGVDISTPAILPENENQIRPLTRIRAEDQPIVWGGAVQAAKADGVNAPTQRHVEGAVRAHEAAQAASAVPASLPPSPKQAEMFVGEVPTVPELNWVGPFWRLSYRYVDGYNNNRTAHVEIIEQDCPKPEITPKQYLININGQDYGVVFSLADAQGRVKDLSKILANGGKK